MSDCLFCRILAGEIPARAEYQDESVVVIRDIHPQAPEHLLILPRKHIAKIADLTAGDVELMGRVVFAAKRLAEEKKWRDYRLVFNNGAEAGQTVYHIHLHLLSGRAMHWPPG